MATDYFLKIDCLCVTATQIVEAIFARKLHFCGLPSNRFRTTAGFTS